MIMWTEYLFDSLYDAVIDCLKVMPILFVAYLLVAYLSHDHNHKFSNFLSKNRKTSVLYASFLGCVPQCGFSSVVADLYSRQKVTLGTLVAVFVATSDEAIPIMLSSPESILDMLLLIAIKIVLALVWGYAIDFCISFIEKKHKQKKEEVSLIEEHHSHSHHHECGHIHTDECKSDCHHSHGKNCAENIFLDAFIHTFEIMIYIFIATFIINLIVQFFDESVLRNILTTNVYIQIIIASLIGLCPNCASSVFLVELYLQYGALSFPALVAGLSSGAGVGLFILFSKNHKKVWQNIGIVILQYAIGVISGLLISLFF